MEELFISWCLNMRFKMKKIVWLVAIVLSSSVFGGGSGCSGTGWNCWEGDSAADKIVKQNELRMLCQANPSRCPDSYNNGGVSSSSSSSSNSFGSPLQSSQTIGNNVTIIVNGDGNSVDYDGNQSNQDSTLDSDATMEGNELVQNLEYIENLEDNSSTHTSTIDNSETNVNVDLDSDYTVIKPQGCKLIDMISTCELQ